jgi:hypothetical protein
MSDNEDTPSPLWDGSRVAVHSDILSVQHSVGEPVPELRQPPKEGTKVPSSVARQNTGHVFPDAPARPQPFKNAEIDEGEVSSRVVKSFAETCD